jgi:hypothetical protein
MPNPSPPELSETEWVHLVLHSVQTILSARNQAKPLNQRTLEVLVPLDCMASAVPATVQAARASFRKALADCRAYFCIGKDSEALFDAAMTHLRLESSAIPEGELPSAICALSHTAEHAFLRNVLLFGHSRDGAGTGRTEFRSAVDARWLPFLGSLGLLGHAFTSVLHGKVERALLPDASTTVWRGPMPSFRSLPEELQQVRTEINEAWLYVFEMVFAGDGNGDEEDQEKGEKSKKTKKQHKADAAMRARLVHV